MSHLVDDIRELVKALEAVTLTCETLHHRRSDYHADDMECPVVARLVELRDRVRD